MIGAAGRRLNARTERMVGTPAVNDHPFKHFDASMSSSPALDAFRRCAPLFAALGDPHRQAIVMLLAEHDALNVNRITEALPLSRPAVSHHLKVLLQAGIVRRERVSRENYYVLQLEAALGELKHLVNLAEQDCIG